MIGATNMSGVISDKFKDDALGRRFQTVMLKEPGGAEMLEIVKRKYPDEVITKEVRECLYSLKSKLRPKFSDPDATLFLMEDLKVWYEMKRQREGATRVAIHLEHLKEYLEENYFVRHVKVIGGPFLGLQSLLSSSLKRGLHSFSGPVSKRNHSSIVFL